MPAFEASKRKRSGRPSEPTPLLRPLDDAVLADRLASGDRWAQEAFFRKYVAYVWGIALRSTADRASAEAVVQEAFAEALRDVWHLREGKLFQRWLTRLAVRSAERRLRRQRLLRALGRAHERDEVARLESIVSPDAAPAVALELQRLDAVLVGLSARRRIAWSLRYVEGCPVEEIAEHVRRSPAAVERDVRAAQLALRGRVEIDVENKGELARAVRPVLCAPLHEVLDDTLPEAQLQRIWRTLQALPVQRARRSRRRMLVLALAASTLAIAGAGAYVFRAPVPAETLGALTIPGGGELTPERTLGGVEASTVELSDGSQIALDAASLLQVLVNDGSAFVVRLDAGRARFEVRAGGPRRWIVKSGPASVEVLGTRFTVDRGVSGVSVHVARGVVMVRGAQHGAPNAPQRLAAGAHLFVPNR